MDFQQQPMNQMNSSMTPRQQMPVNPAPEPSSGNKIAVIATAIVVIAVIAAVAWYFFNFSPTTPSLPGGAIGTQVPAAGTQASSGDTISDITSDLNQANASSGLVDDLDALSKDLQGF